MTDIKSDRPTNRAIRDFIREIEGPTDIRTALLDLFDSIVENQAKIERLERRPGCICRPND